MPRVIMALRTDALVATGHLRREIESSTSVVFPACQPEPVVGVFLKRLKVTDLQVDDTEGIK